MAKRGGKKMKQRGGKNSSDSGGARGFVLLICVVGFFYLLGKPKASHSNPAGARVVLNRGRV